MIKIRVNKIGKKHGLKHWLQRFYSVINDLKKLTDKSGKIDPEIHLFIMK